METAKQRQKEHEDTMKRLIEERDTLKKTLDEMNIKNRDEETKLQTAYGSANETLQTAIQGYDMEMKQQTEQLEQEKAQYNEQMEELKALKEEWEQRVEEQRKLKEVDEIIRKKQEE